MTHFIAWMDNLFSSFLGDAAHCTRPWGPRHASFPPDIQVRVPVTRLAGCLLRSLLLRSFRMRAVCIIPEHGSTMCSNLSTSMTSALLQSDCCADLVISRSCEITDPGAAAIGEASHFHLHSTPCTLQPMSLSRTRPGHDHGSCDVQPLQIETSALFPFVLRCV